jgi:basic membrane lipoprotein Med (substrate-binding protein (PBP1-ABC) superfamily)
MTRRQLIQRATALGLSVPAIGAVLAACGGDDEEGAAPAPAEPTPAEPAPSGEPFKVGFIYIGPPGDAGWTFQHDEARKFVQDTVPNVETSFLDSVPEANAGPGIDQLISEGNKLIFATSFGYGDVVIQKAQENPDVLFEHATGFQLSDNVSTYFVQHWEPSFLLGVIAGRMTQANRLGYVGSFPIPEVIRDVNSFTLGAQSVNPDITTQMLFINTWFDPPTEQQAARSLIDAGADILFGIEDSPAILQEAVEHDGVLAATWNSDMSRFGPEAYLSSVVLNWGPRYALRTQQAIDGTWQSEDWWGTLADDAVQLAPYGESVPDDVRAEVDEKLAGFEDGSFKPFVGPIADQAGQVQIADGEEVTFEQFVTWDWFVEGVEGTLPS